MSKIHIYTHTSNYVSISLYCLHELLLVIENGIILLLITPKRGSCLFPTVHAAQHDSLKRVVQERFPIVVCLFVTVDVTRHYSTKHC